MTAQLQSTTLLGQARYVALAGLLVALPVSFLAAGQGERAAAGSDLSAEEGRQVVHVSLPAQADTRSAPRGSSAQPAAEEASPQQDVVPVGTTRDREALERESREAVRKGLRWLAEQQEVEEVDGQLVGYWRNDVGFKLNTSYRVEITNGRHPGVTALACLAFMANGHYPGRGAYGEVVRRGMNFILHAIPDSADGVDGFISFDGSRMYSHAFAALFLAELLGMSNLSASEEEYLRQKLRRAITMIVDRQNAEGGWRYAPGSTDSDMSQVVCQLQALRAAQSVGIQVPVQTINRAREHIANSYVTSSRAGRQHFRSPHLVGEFKYQHSQQPTRTSWTLTSAGLVALQQAGNYSHFEHPNGRTYSLERTIDRLTRHPRTNQLGGHDFDQSLRGQIPFCYFYGHYYAAQGIYQYGRDHPQVWEEWHEFVQAQFVRQFRRIPGENKGYWSDQIGDNYATAMACLVLQLHHEYLPIFLK